MSFSPSSLQPLLEVFFQPIPVLLASHLQGQLSAMWKTHAAEFCTQVIQILHQEKLDSV